MGRPNVEDARRSDCGRLPQQSNVDAPTNTRKSHLWFVIYTSPSLVEQTTRATSRVPTLTRACQDLRGTLSGALLRDHRLVPPNRCIFSGCAGRIDRSGRVQPRTRGDRRHTAVGANSVHYGLTASWKCKEGFLWTAYQLGRKHTAGGVCLLDSWTKACRTIVWTQLCLGNPCSANVVSTDAGSGARGYNCTCLDGFNSRTDQRVTCAEDDGVGTPCRRGEHAPTSGISVDPKVRTSACVTKVMKKRRQTREANGHSLSCPPASCEYFECDHGRRSTAGQSATLVIGGTGIAAAAET